MRLVVLGDCPKWNNQLETSAHSPGELRWTFPSPTFCAYSFGGGRPFLVVPFVGGLVSDRKAYAYLPQSTAYLPPPEELKEMLSGVGFLEVARESLFLGAAQILTGVRGPLTPVGGGRS